MLSQGMTSPPGKALSIPTDLSKESYRVIPEGDESRRLTGISYLSYRSPL